MDKQMYRNLWRKFVGQNWRSLQFTIIALSFAIWSISLSWYGRAYEPPADIIPPRDAGGRGEICLISPRSSLIWSGQPLFIWRGAVDRVAVIDGMDEVVWQAEPTEADGVVALRYEGEALESGHYTWRVSQLDLILESSFQVMSAEEREAIAAELDLETQSEEATEAAIFTRIEYFAERELWAEALREAFAVEEPNSEKLVGYRQAVVSHLCE